MHRFDTDPTDGDYANNVDLRNLPFGRGEECLQDFEKDGSSAGPARLRRLTVITKVLERATTNPNDPNIRQHRALMLLYQDGVNRQ